jgi:uncharacterized protein YqeY
MLHQQLTEDLKTAMKAGGDFEIDVLRMLLSVLHNKEIEKRGKPRSESESALLRGKGQEPALTNEEVIEVLSREVKKRNEAADLYAKGNRRDLSEKEIREAEIIKKYLPEQLSEEEIEKIVKAAIEKTGAKDVKDFGKAMADAMKELKGKADASVVSKLIKEKIEKAV